MTPDTLIEVPACGVCHDWMFPATLWVWPVDGVCWVCLNGCGSLFKGRLHSPQDEMPSQADAFAITTISYRVAEARDDYVE